MALRHEPKQLVDRPKALGPIRVRWWKPRRRWSSGTLINAMRSVRRRVRREPASIAASAQTRWKPAEVGSPSDQRCAAAAKACACRAGGDAVLKGHSTHDPHVRVAPKGAETVGRPADA